ncbi:MAG: protein kinase [Proteobacteria bacterium]|nr:protein kinase [Pseudomonadota bacterium]
MAKKLQIDQPIPVGPFELTELLGRGGMGTVWRGRHRVDGVPVAIKLIRPSLRWGSRILEQFAIEVRAVASLHHPAIVHVLDLGEVTDAEAEASDGHLPAASPWLVMELCSGGTLHDHRGMLSWPRVRPVLLSLLDALAHSHARGVIHRDIKPGNVLIGTSLDQRPGLKLTDFGIARMADPDSGDVSLETEFAGSPAFCAPEQLLGEVRRIGPWTDLYAVGCLAWALLTGSPPYGSHQPLAKLMAAHVGGKLPDLEPLDPVPPALVTWLHTLLARRPEDRFQCAADAAWSLRELAPMALEEALAADLIPAGEALGRATRTQLLSMASGGDQTAALTMSEDATRVDATALALTDSLPIPENPPEEQAAAPDTEVRHPRPPTPEDWRRPESSPPPRLFGAGLGLYASRTVPLVGRHEERDRIWGALHDVIREGTSRGVVVRGASGVGKSRLVKWMAERAEELGVASVVRAVHADPAGPADGIGPMVARLLSARGTRRNGLLLAAGRWLGARGRKDMYLRSAAAELVQPGVSRALDAEYRVRFDKPEHRHQTLSDLLALEAARRPVILWLDDAQWGGDALRLAHHLISRRNDERHPVLLLLTVRDEGLADGSDEAAQLDALLALDGTQPLPLTRLLEADHRRLVHELLRLDSRLTEEVVQRTGGSPLFALQLVGDWVQRGVLVPTRDGFVPAEGAQLTIPDDIHDLWTARFGEAIGTDARDAVEVGAVLGAQVDMALWRQACGRPAAELGPVLVALMRAGLISATESGWAFVHGMARESILRSAEEGGHLASLNTRCADALEASDEPAAVEQRARHRLAAGDVEQAAPDLWAALEHHDRRGDVAAARQVHGLLMDALNGPEAGAGNVERLRARARGLELERFVVGPERELLDRAAAVLAESEAASCDEVTVRLRTLMGRLMRDGKDLPEGAELLREAYELAGARDLPEATARAATGLAWARLLQGDRKEAAKLFRHAVKLLKRIDDQRGLARAWLGLAELFNHVDDDEQGAAYAQRGLEAAEAAGDVAVISSACVHMGSIVGKTDPAAALVWLKRARLCAQRVGSRSQLANVLNVLGDVARKTGDLALAEESLRESLVIFDAGGWSWASLVRLNLVMVLMGGARFEEASAPLELARARFVADGREPMIQIADLLRLPILAARGDAAGLDSALRSHEHQQTWMRWAQECLDGLRWAGAIARRGGLDAQADRLDALTARYEASRNA